MSLTRYISSSMLLTHVDFTQSSYIVYLSFSLPSSFSSNALCTLFRVHVTTGRRLTQSEGEERIDETEKGKESRRLLAWWMDECVRTMSQSLRSLVKSGNR